MRNPAAGFKSFVWNAIASRSLSISGKEMFALDIFRDTGRSVLALLADPDSIFVAGLRRFQRLSLYSNITNDKNTDYYTTSIQRVDPFADLEGRAANYAKGYDRVMLDPGEPLKPPERGRLPRTGTLSSLLSPRTLLRYAFTAAIMPFYIPLLILVGLVYSLVQTTQSRFRISRHESGAAGISIDKYRVPVLVHNATGRAVLDTLGYGHPTSQARSQSWTEALADLQPLALDSQQLAMADGLDTLSWRRHPVWIRNPSKAHEAIIVNSDHTHFEEGWVVLGHFANGEFLV